MGDETADDADDTPEPDWDGLRAIPRCALENCRHYDGKRCVLTGFEPGSVCEPAVFGLSEAIAVVLANPSMGKKQRHKWLLHGLQLTQKEFDELSG